MTRHKPLLSAVNPGATYAQTHPHPQPPPRPLGRHGTTLWKEITSSYVITDPPGVECLLQCCKMLDRAEDIAEAIEAEGVMTTSPRGGRIHSGVKEELMCRSFVVKNLEKLGLLSEPLHAQPGRQPDGRNAGIKSSLLLPLSLGE